MIRRALLTALLMALTPGGRAVAGPEPVVVLDGALPPGSLTRGTWAVRAAGVARAAGAPGHMDVLVPPGPAFRDGVVHAELDLAERPNVTVLLRAHTRHAPGGDPEGLSAVGLTIDRRGIRWDRWDAGVTLPIGPRVPADVGGRPVRITLEARDRVLRATLVPRDGGASVTAVVQDAGSGSGRAGIRVHDDGTSALRRLEVVPEPLDAPVDGDPAAPLGVERFVLLPADERSLVPEALAATILGTWPYDERGHLGLLLPDQAALDRLRQAGATPEVRPLVPFWAWDPDVRAAAGRVPVGPEGPDLTRSYKDAGMVEVILRDWAERYPEHTHLFELEQSHRGRPLLALRITDQPSRYEPDEPAVLLQGAMHGSELLATEYVLDAAQRLLRGIGADPAWTRRAEGLDIWVVPLVNPDGNDVVHRITRFGGRKNGRDTTPDGRVGPWEGVDLNRNFPLGFGRDEQASRSFPNAAHHRGPHPLSEPESRMVHDLAEALRFAAALSFHTNGSMILVPYSLEGVPQTEPHLFWGLAEEIVADVPVQPSGKPLRVRRMIYPVDGSDQDWLAHRFGTAAYVVEGSHHNPVDPTLRRASIDALRPLVPSLLDRVLDGPRVSGHVVEADGTPVEAVVTVDAVQQRAGEAWTSRPSDGRFDRLLPAGGAVRVTATSLDGRSASATVRAQPVGTVRLVLPPPAAP
jgi:hypothetical protein